MSRTINLLPTRTHEIDTIINSNKPKKTYKFDNTDNREHKSVNGDLKNVPDGLDLIPGRHDLIRRARLRLNDPGIPKVPVESIYELRPESPDGFIEEIINPPTPRRGFWTNNTDNR